MAQEHWLGGGRKELHILKTASLQPLSRARPMMLLIPLVHHSLRRSQLRLALDAIILGLFYHILKTVPEKFIITNQAIIFTAFILGSNLHHPQKALPYFQILIQDLN